MLLGQGRDERTEECLVSEGVGVGDAEWRSDPEGRGLEVIKMKC